MGKLAMLAPLVFIDVRKKTKCRDTREDDKEQL